MRTTQAIRQLFLLAMVLSLLIVAANYAMIARYVQQKTVSTHMSELAEKRSGEAVALTKEVELLHTAALVLGFGSLGILVGMWWLIFRPMLRNISEAMKSLRMQQTVINSANDGIIITKADLRSPGPEIVYVNEAICRITGYVKEEIIGRSPALFQGEDTDRKTLNAMRESLSRGEPFTGELLNYTKDHTPYWLEINVVPITDAAGEITHFAAIERDITARKKADTELFLTLVQLKRANLKAEAVTRDLEDSLQRAEEATRAKSNFLANMSHELRTPMNGVLGMAQLLADTPMDAEQRELIQIINDSADNLLVLLNDILDFSKIEAGALTLEHTPFTLRGTIASATKLLQAQAEKKNIGLHVEYDALLPAYIWGDSSRLRQVVINLLGNAIKFTQQGHVALRLTAHADQEFMIQVIDTGPGIELDKQKTIFEKFTQGDASVTRKYGGTGLGLAITQQLVTLMGGTIGLESVPGKGSTFWVKLPLQPADAEGASLLEEVRAIPATTHERVPVAQARILLVEDYPINQVFAEKLLQKFGVCHIDHAENGDVAVMLSQVHRYDMIFMDCQMPEMDGYEATMRIRQLEKTLGYHTPIVAMTANAMVGDREKCLKSGMDDYLSKPLRAHHLHHILEMWFELKIAAPVLANPQCTVTVAADDMPVDLEQLRLFTDGDPEEESALFTLFYDQAQSVIQLLQDHVNDHDDDAWKAATHRLKGAAANLGANRLQYFCKKGEESFTATRDEKQAMLADISEETERVRLFFLAKQSADQGLTSSATH